MAVLTPTVVIGVGSSGLDTLEGIQKLMYETFGVNKFDPIEYVSIETAVGARAKPTPAGDDIRYVQVAVSSGDTTRFIDKIKEEFKPEDTTWIPEGSDKKIAKLDKGAGNMRYAGRLVLWRDLMYERNIKNMIENQINRVISPAVLTKQYGEKVQLLYNPQNDPVNVYVVGTLTGGTCSGMFIDLAYVIKSIAGGKSVHLTGILGVPDGYEAKGGGRAHRANAYMALKELSYFMHADNRYEEQLPGIGSGLDNYRNETPYDAIYIVSTKWATGDPLGETFDHKLKTLYNTVSFMIFTSLIGLEIPRRANAVNVKKVLTNVRYLTFGTSAAIYPKYSILEGAACDIGERIVGERFLNKKSYSDVKANYQKRSITRAAVKDDAEIFFVNVLAKEAYDSFDSTGMDPYDMFIGPLDREEITEDEFINGIKNKLSYDFYQIMVGQIPVVHKRVEDRLEKELAVLFDDVENLEYIEAFLDEVEKAKEEQLKYSRKKPYIEQHWKEYVNKQAVKINKKFGGVAKRDLLLRDRLYILLNDLKESVLYEYIKSEMIEQYIVKKREEFKKLREKLQGTESTKGVLEFFRKRKAEVIEEVKDKYRPLYRMYVTGSYEGDLRNLQEQFLMYFGDGLDNRSKVLGKKALGIQRNLYRSLNGEKGAANTFEDIKNHLIVKMTEPLPGQDESAGRKISALPELNVIENASKSIEPMRIYLTGTHSGLIGLYTGVSDNLMSNYIVGESGGGIRDYKNHLQNRGILDFNNSHEFEIPDLRHMLLIHKERGILSNDDLKDFDNFRRCYEDSLYKDEFAEGETEEYWREGRRAYDLKWRESYSNLKRLGDFISNVGFKWKGGKVIKKTIHAPELIQIDNKDPGFRVEYGGEPVDVNLKDEKRLRSIAAGERDLASVIEEELRGFVAEVSEEQIRTICSDSDMKAHFQKLGMTPLPDRILDEKRALTKRR
ncbi:MAG: hypothetical protein JW984_04470 [Deltaproteobacteria bacterium]|uniref:Tubulin like n=1 Tax=Candidatus Zymogenus saltonus TaxID=2844893 RepID=A0A9D8PN50_9DELT|nr:hypothetical protein [Candidatus Zymogenus saltonus]